jgi:hypothetical protein
MISIPKPTYKVTDVFTLCISTVNDEILKQQLNGCLPTLIFNEAEFDNKFPKNEIYLIPQANNITSEINKEEMKKIYTYRMLHKEQAGRHYYDKILSSSPDGLCPYCSIREADTLDHYLAKTKYPVFAVTPINLIPSCTPCNIDKKVEYPKSNIDQTLHPYYDKVDDVNWIKAVIIKSNPVAIAYFPLPPDWWDETLKKRAINHFESFGLAELYGSNANRRLKGDRLTFIDLFNTNPIHLKSHLFSSYQSSLSLGVNSFEAILFDTLYNDNWFCTVGVNY